MRGVQWYNQSRHEVKWSLGPGHLMDLAAHLSTGEVPHFRFHTLINREFAYTRIATTRVSSPQWGSSKIA